MEIGIWTMIIAISAVMIIIILWKNSKVNKKKLVMEKIGRSVSHQVEQNAQVQEECKEIYALGDIKIEPVFQNESEGEKTTRKCDRRSGFHPEECGKTGNDMQEHVETRKDKTMDRKENGEADTNKIILAEELKGETNTDSENRNANEKWKRQAKRREEELRREIEDLKNDVQAYEEELIAIRIKERNKKKILKENNRRREQLEDQRQREYNQRRYKTASGKPGHCFNCAEMGHMSRDCPRKIGNEQRCYTCFKEGHVARNCPRKVMGNK